MRRAAKSHYRTTAKNRNMFLRFMISSDYIPNTCPDSAGKPRTRPAAPPGPRSDRMRRTTEHTVRTGARIARP
ncbi:Uncharacterised protein [Mycobacteroides abscessus subsp. abscessus]|nr:Uncharacterised protein [Mycobacteroides abscessus subsp. abscessus]